MTAAEQVRAIGLEIGAWSSRREFRTADDIPRIPRPSPNWVPPIHPDDVHEVLRERDEFAARLEDIDLDDADISTEVDYFALRAVLQRAHWDIVVLRNWERNAVFLIGQVLGPWYDLLLPQPPFSEEVQRALVEIAAGLPARLSVARENLERTGVRDLAMVALEEMGAVHERFADSVTGLLPFLNESNSVALRSVFPDTHAALAGFVEWLKSAQADFADSTPVGREHFQWFLRNIALVSEEPEELVRSALQDYRRALVSETLARNRFRDVPEAENALSSTAQATSQRQHEAEIRVFLEQESLLTQPETLQKYHVAEIPAYLAPLHFLGMADELTDEHRLDQDGVAYFPPPTPDLPYFYAANAKDPRLGIIHEGAHYKQLSLAAAHINPIRRRYVDSCANEGIAFYNEEMMLIAGLFEDAPHSQVVIHNFNRLRSLRVVVDINLAMGTFTLTEAIDFFVEMVPMDRETASEECAMYLATPGLAMSYHVGKQQLMRLAADALVRKADQFSLREFHDYVWRNGNLPFSLQRYEYLEDRSDLVLLGY